VQLDQQEINFSCLREKDIAEAFHISTRQVRNWVQSGCPRSANGYDLYQVHCWLLEREKKNITALDGGSLKDKKTLEEINVLQKRQEKMDFEIQNLKDTTIPKDTHERVKLSIIESFVNFLNNSLKRNIAKMRAVPDSEANDMVDQFCIDLTTHMTTSGRQAERV
jgi:phage terminase Nu1 subunit (DNA packaging protein)